MTRDQLRAYDAERLAAILTDARKLSPREVLSVATRSLLQQSKPART
jgi:hypothetical protein